MNNIVLIGFMGSGKTSVARVLGEKINFNVIDMDAEIEKRENQTINEIFKEFGEEHFRDLETAYLEKLLNKKNKIISTGGGVIVREKNIELLKQIGRVIFLHTEKEQLLRNLKNANNRPLLKGEDLDKKISTMLTDREPAYLNAADIIIQTTGKDIESVANEIMALI